MRDESIYDVDGETAEEWLERMFEFEYCEECGRDADEHTPILIMGHWFARCDNPC